jgi:hypothetical protein
VLVWFKDNDIEIAHEFGIVVGFPADLFLAREIGQGNDDAVVAAWVVAARIEHAVAPQGVTASEPDGFGGFREHPGLTGVRVVCIVGSGCRGMAKKRQANEQHYCQSPVAARSPGAYVQSEFPCHRYQP